MNQRRRTSSRLVFGAFLGGVLAGVFGAFLHPDQLLVGPVPIPIGIAAAVGLIVVAHVVAARSGPGPQPWAVAIGWTLTILVLTWPRAAGDVVVPATVFGNAFLVLGAFAAFGGAIVQSARLRDSSPSASPPSQRG